MFFIFFLEIIKKNNIELILNLPIIFSFSKFQKIHRVLKFKITLNVVILQIN